MSTRHFNEKLEQPHFSVVKEALISFFKLRPEANTDVNSQSLRVDIDNHGVKLDMKSLLTNARVTDQALKILEKAEEAEKAK